MPTISFEEGPRCTDVFPFAEEVLSLIRDTKKGEQGFIVCRDPTSMEMEVGATCKDDADHCTIKNPVCPPGKEPYLSFHTHDTKRPRERPPVGEAAKALLLPSSRDAEADARVRTKVGCVGGDLNDGTAFAWCFPARKDGELEPIRKRVSENLGNGAALVQIVSDYLDVLKPCLEVRVLLGTPEPEEGCHVCEAVKAMFPRGGLG